MALLITIIVLAIAFDFINGFHDSANSIATVVSTKVLRPFIAVLWAAVFNFIAFFIAKYLIGEFGVAQTVQNTVVEETVTLHLLVAGMVAAIIWNLLTWWKGIPSSSSHTLIGGLMGAAIAAQGWNAVHWGTVGFIALFIFVAPLIGFVSGNLIAILTYWVAKRVKPHRADKWFKRLQLISSAGLSIGHGLNDSQKAMGVVACALMAYTNTYQIKFEELPHWLTPMSSLPVPEWVPFACFFAMAIGTMSGGMKIIKTMGNKITKLTPVEGFCSQTSGAITLLITEILKVPVSTTHVISGGIMGVGSVKRLSAVRWGVTIELLTAWIITIPVSALIGAGVYGVMSIFL